MRNVRSGVGVAEDVSVLEVLGVGAHLEVFFEGFLAVDGGEGGLVDGGVCGCFVCHDCFVFVFFCDGGWRVRLML